MLFLTETMMILLTGKMDGKVKTTLTGMLTKQEKEISEWKLNVLVTTMLSFQKFQTSLLKEQQERTPEAAGAIEIDAFQFKKEGNGDFSNIIIEVMEIILKEQLLTMVQQ